MHVVKKTEGKKMNKYNINAEIIESWNSHNKK